MNRPPANPARARRAAWTRLSHRFGARPHLRARFIVGVLASLMVAVITFAQSPPEERVLLVVNDASPASVQVAEHYVARRPLAPDHVIHLRLPLTESISRADYLSLLEGPLGAYLIKHALEDQILYVVLTKGVPIRIAGTGGLEGTMASVDSELALLYRRLVGTPVAIIGRVDNPYFLGEKPVGQAQAFSRETSDIYLVTRLDGFTVEDVFRLIDRGAAPEATGSVVLDEKATLVDRGGDQWLEQTAERLQQAGQSDRVVLERTRAVASVPGPVIGYFSWGSNDPANHLRQFGLKFVPGAIAGMFVSTDGRTFAEPPGDWLPSSPTGGTPWMGSFQSLAGDLVRDGVTGVSAHVAEPYLDATVHPQILFPAYLAGFNLAESYYLALPYLSWQTMVIGDPLCAPFAQNAAPVASKAPTVDPDTGLTPTFQTRAIAARSAGGLKPEAVRVALMGDHSARGGDLLRAEAFWVQATTAEPRLVDVHRQLASFYEARGAHDKAIERYRKIIAVASDDAIALNNLAFDLAVYQNAPQEALPYAQKAVSVSQTPTVIDTLGWTEHLLGNNAEAGPILERAVAMSPGDGEIWLHSAAVQTALSHKARAKFELDTAVRLSPGIGDRADVKALRTALAGG